MHIKLSKTLRQHLDSGMTEARRSRNPSILADAAILSIIREGMSHASHILQKLLRDWELEQLTEKIEREAARTAASGGNPDSAELERAMTAMVTDVAAICLATNMALRQQPKNPNGTALANTGHFLLWVLGNKSLAASRTLSLYGITIESVGQLLHELPEDESYYSDIEMLRRLGREHSELSRDEIPQDGNNADFGDEPEDSFDDVPEEDFGDNRRGAQATATKTRKRTKSALDPFGVNLSVMAAEGKIDPVVGRDREIERLIQILGRRKKNNPILIGEAGVGKSAIVEGLALRMAAGEVPQSLEGKQIFSLDMASLVAGTKYRGEFEQRIKGLLTELKRSSDIILFIDEIHTIAGAGSTQGSLDTANILKPALARGEIQCIGATTLDEFRENIESDGALERRFQKIIVEPATKEETLQILTNIKGHYEKHHGVRYTDEALRACVELTDRYITDRHFPDKAIDALDEAGSKARQFKVEEPEPIRDLEKKLSEMIDGKQSASGRKKFDEREDIESRVRIMSLRSRIRECRAQWQREITMNPFVVEASHIEEVITNMTGIPVEKVSQDDRQRLASMNTHLSSLVIGQSAAVDKVVKSIQRSRTGLKDPRKPIGVFMFVGPTGVGKTHLAKELSQWMFDKRDALIRVDMSEYSEKHNVSRMIGSPPGYVGYNEGGQLTEAVRRQPYAVVLFDEIEKAHPDVFNIMLQIFDEGQLTDGNGRKVDFRNTIIIMTSNVGSRAVAERPKAVGYTTGNTRQVEQTANNIGYREALQRTFAPEFINRIDDIVVFNTLSVEDVERIVELELRGLTQRTKTLGYEFRVTSKARKALAGMGYDSRYGVRSLKRTILEHVEEPIAELIVSGQLQPGDTLRVDSKGGAVEVTKHIPARRTVLSPLSPPEHTPAAS